MRVAELLIDTIYTRPVELIDVATGDAIAIFQSDKPGDPLNAHVGSAVVEEGEVFLLHSARHKGEVIIEKLADVLEHDKYSTIAGIKRPVVRGSFILPAASLTY